MMPDGVALRDVEDDCAALCHALFELAPIIVLTWPQIRQPSLATEGGQPLAVEMLYLNHMGETERKWYLKQHEFTTSLQRCVCFTACSSIYVTDKLMWARTNNRNLTRLSLLALRVREDPDAAYRGSILERISQFTAKFEDVALRLKVRTLLSHEHPITRINRTSAHSLLITFGSSKGTARVCATRHDVSSVRSNKRRRTNTIRQSLATSARRLKQSSTRCVPSTALDGTPRGECGMIVSCTVSRE